MSSRIPTEVDLQRIKDAVAATEGKFEICIENATKAMRQLTPLACFERGGGANLHKQLV